MFNNQDQEFKSVTDSNNNENLVNNPQPTPEVIPIPEIKVEQNSIEETNKIENTIEPNNIMENNIQENNQIVEEVPDINNQSNNKSPENSKLTTVLLVLLFIFLFAFIMFMPNINDLIQKYEDSKKTPTSNPETAEESPKPTTTPAPSPATVILNKLTCTSNTEENENYTLTEVQVFNFNTTKQILSSSLEYQYKFTAIDDTYNELQQLCSDNSLKYVSNLGYTFSCNYDGTNINIGHEFDLKDFTTIVDGDTSIEANATYKQIIDEVKTALLIKGYTCR